MVRQLATASLIVLSLAGFVLSASKTADLPRKRAADEMRVAIPPHIQVFMAGGDRYLAANIAAIRAAVVGTGHLSDDTIIALGNVQRDAARLNPKHEDNYYIANAVLPWRGNVDAAQFALEAAARSRRDDLLPAFFHAFNSQHFSGKYLEAGKELIDAAQRSHSLDERRSLEAIATRWIERHDDDVEAAAYLDKLAQETTDAAFKDYIHQRKAKLAGLMLLRRAVKEYNQRVGRPPEQATDLLKAGVLAQLPIDPFGIGYVLNAAHEPMYAKIGDQGIFGKSP
jgi:hypothetical protein